MSQQEAHGADRPHDRAHVDYKTMMLWLALYSGCLVNNAADDILLWCFLSLPWQSPGGVCLAGQLSISQRCYTNSLEDIGLHQHIDA